MTTVMVKAQKPAAQQALTAWSLTSGKEMETKRVRQLGTHGSTETEAVTWVDVDLCIQVVVKCIFG